MDRNQCCGIKNWTKFISWLQTIGYACVALSFAVRLGTGIGMVPWDLVDRGVNMTPDAAYILMTEAHNIKVVSAAAMALGILGFIVSLVLLKGTYDVSPKLLNVWIVAASICLTFWIAMVILWSLFTFRDLKMQILWTAVGLIPLIIVQSFCIWTVCGYRRQIQNEDTLGVHYYSTDE
ncbi:unnamed protein product [Allacma fusca]|uniref:Uncharacterized protein n=1 Tax=Allacma fusca TaxID=39272 RepID=A0A8J2LQJ3_9HEXA|nr:unnamed protein product [Allacma fusca]